MRLRKVSVTGLFGLFDHTVELRLADRITIIHAPNGYGKTVLLKLIAAMFGGSLATFRRYDFDTITYEFDDKSTLVVTRTADEDGPYADSELVGGYLIEGFSKKKVSLGVWNPSLRSKDDRLVAPSAFERYVPGLRRVGPRMYRNVEGERLHYEDLIERYWQALPVSARRSSHLPEWLDNARAAINCELIETQRLLVQRSDPHRPDRESQSVLAVKSYSEALATSLNRTLAQSATLSQSLDRTFPNRILAKMHRSPEFDELTVRGKLTELEQKRARLAKVDLLENSDDGSLVSHETFDEVALKILGEYASDAENKLRVFDKILTKVELFTELLNSRFSFKRVAASRSEGFKFTNVRGAPLDVSSLSSGEQHELILLYNLIFRSTENTLLLIDEPEISLHIAWQKKFLSDLRRIIEISPMDVVLATHSPQIISGNLDLAIQLSGSADAAKF